MLLCRKEGRGIEESLTREVRGSCRKYVEVASPFVSILSAVVNPLVALSIFCSFNLNFHQCHR
jgi:hypothetical protein